MFNTRNNTAIGLGLLCATLLWGGNNTGIKFLVSHWPPVWTACTRMLCIGGILLVLLRWTRLLGPFTPLTPTLRRHLWWRGGLSLAVYVTVFTWSLKFTSASHVALYLGAAPIWALLCESGPRASWECARRYGAAALALAGLLILFWPKLQHGGGDWRGDMLALSASVLCGQPTAVIAVQWAACCRASRSRPARCGARRCGCYPLPFGKCAAA